jgi:hypothetical protein
MGHDPGLAASPPARNNLEVGEVVILLFPFPLRASPLRSDGAPHISGPSSTFLFALTLGGNLGVVDQYL